MILGSFPQYSQNLLLMLILDPLRSHANVGLSFTAML